MWIEVKRKAGALMKHAPYGYEIIDGKAVVNEEQAETVRAFYKGYISGLALTVAAKEVGLNLCHASAGKWLRNKHYLGDDFYPTIIDKETFDKAEEVRIAKASSLGRIRELKTTNLPDVPTKFIMKQATQKYTDAFDKAEYLYSLIESEVVINGE